MIKYDELLDTMTARNNELLDTVHIMTARNDELLDTMAARNNELLDIMTARNNELLDTVHTMYTQVLAQHKSGQSRIAALASCAMTANQLSTVWHDRHYHIDRIIDSIYG